MAACIKSKASLERVQELMKWDPAPVSVYGLNKLRESVRAAETWLDKYSTVLVSNDKAPLELKVLEDLAKEVGATGVVRVWVWVLGLKAWG